MLPSPDSLMPSWRRTLDVPPSQPTRYCAVIFFVWPPSFTVAVTEPASCSNDSASSICRPRLPVGPVPSALKPALTALLQSLI